jgi:dipeptidyl aminopeptidase/acylaminoacyl peptidase
MDSLSPGGAQAQAMTRGPAQPPPPALRRLAPFLSLLAVAAPGHAADPPPIGVADALRTAHIVPEDNLAQPDRPSPVSISPDRKRFVVRVATGDVERNGVRLDLLAGSLASLDAAADLKKVASLFSPALGSETSPYHPALANFANPVWVGETRLAFPWEDSKGLLQYVAIDLVAGRTRWLTRHPTDVLVAAANARGDILYAAQRARADGSAGRIARGFVVEAADAISVLRGQDASTLDLYYDLDLFLRHGEAAAKPLDLRFRWAIAFQPLLSPDGSFAIVNAWPKSLPESWRGRYRPAAAGAVDPVAEAFRDRDSWYGRQVTQLFIVDLTSGSVRPLWDAPTRDPVRLRAAWSPDGSLLAIGPTWLPAGQSGAGGAGEADVVMVERASGRIVRLTLPGGGKPLAIAGLRFAANDRLLVEGRDGWLRFDRQQGEWRLSDAKASPAADGPSVDILLREGLNQPPRLHARDAATGAEKMIFDPNPGLADRFALGRVEAIAFPDREGRKWSALLYHPVGERAGERYPLVIQTHSHAPTDSFSLYGPGMTAPGTGPSWSIYAAQPLAGRGMFVLQLEDKKVAGVSLTPREPEMYMRAYEAAVDFLDAKGLIDRQRVGLSGFSRTGWHVEYALTHSDLAFAAAISSDNLAASYVEDVLAPGNLERENGAAPFGAGLESWLETVPAFSAERIRTPLRAQVESGGLPAILFKWELFSRLRRLGAPVELAVVPQVDKGSHNLLNPGQLIAVKQGAVDWYDFWLNGREDSNPAKAEQYRRWRALRERRDRLAVVPRPPLLDWTARPR